MPTAKAKLPDGRTVTLDVPEGTTNEEIQQFVAQQMQAGAFAQGDPAQDVEAGPQRQIQRQVTQTQTNLPEGEFVQTETGAMEVVNGQLRPLRSAGQMAREKLGFEPSEQTIEELTDPNISDRGTILPIGRNEKGEQVFAVPESILKAGEIGLDIVKTVPEALETFNQAMQGRPISGQDLAEVTTAAVIPATGGVGGATRIAKIQKGLSKRQIRNAPSTKDLLKEGSRKINNYKRTGDSLSGDDFATFWVKADDLLKREGFDSENTPAIARRMSSLAKRAEADEIDAQELVNIRRGIRSTLKSVNSEDEDKRLAKILLDEFDNFVLKTPGSQKWTEGRRIYARGKKSQQIEEALATASEQASGLENGIRIELRKILRSEKKRLGFTKDELSAMRSIVKGDITSNALKKLSKIGFGSGQQTNVLGGSLSTGLGAAGGGAIGGPPGAVLGAMAPGAVGAGASKTLERRTVNAVNALRALAAGAKIPERVIFKDTQLTPRALSALGAMTIEEEEVE